MAYRGDPGDALTAPTAEGSLRLELAASHVELAVAERRLVIADRTATVLDGRGRTQLAIGGALVVARDVPREDLGVWIELPRGMRRIFGVEPMSLLEEGGLAALRRLDAVAQRLRAHVADLANGIRRAVELGRRLDKVLLADHGGHYAIYARRLFRGHARLALEIHREGNVVVHDGKHRRQARVSSRFGVTVRGDYLRFAGPDGTDRARIAMPWIAPEDREELARRIGQLVER